MEDNIFLGKLAGLILGGFNKTDDEYREIGNEVINKMKEHPQFEEAFNNSRKLWQEEDI